jgi:cell division septation protein DedD
MNNRRFNLAWPALARALGFAPRPLAAATAAGGRAVNLLFAAGDGDADADGAPTIRAGRRRAAQPTGPEGRARADAPERRRAEEPESPPPSQRASGGGGGGSSGGGRPRRPSAGSNGPAPKIPLLWIGIGLLLLLCCLIAFFVYASRQGGEEPISTPAAISQPTATAASQPAAPKPATATTAATATATAASSSARPTATSPAATPAAAPAAGATKGQTWTIMLYQDATDKALDKDIFLDLNEAERAGSGERVQIVAQIERYQGSGRAAGWTGAKRFYVGRDPDLNTVRSKLAADLGNVNMADPKTLVDFALWAMKTYPADKYALILSDHGMGWPGGWSDPNSSGAHATNAPLASQMGNILYLNEMDQALGQIRKETGLDKFELIGLDACLMSQLEVYAVLAPHARYAVASEETEPALGWAYTSFLQALNANPAMTGGDLAKLIVQSYIEQDQRIVDDQARAEFAGRGSFLGELSAPSAQTVAREMQQDITLTAMDLAALPSLMKSVNDYSVALQRVDPRAIAKARSNAQSFTSIFGSKTPPSFVDLGHLVQLLKRTTEDKTLAAAGDQVLAALGKAVIAEKHGPEKPGATGVSIYFPVSQLYNNPYAGPQSYTAIAGRFAKESAWDEFLAYFYTGRRFQSTDTGNATVPGRSDAAPAAVRSLAAGGIQIGPVTASSKTAAPNKPVLLKTTISGANVGYIKLLVGFLDRAGKSINVADTDHLDSPQTRELSGVYYPVWPETGRFNLEFEWEPVVFAITDGKNRAEALFMPENFGKSRSEATYSVEGIYTFAEGGDARPAKLLFRNGVLRQVFGFTGQDMEGAPREILPTPGDTFTVLERWLDLDAQGKVTKTATQKGKTLTFGSQPFKWQTLDAAAGVYVVGFIVEDLDGNQTAVYTQVTVQ